MKRLICLMLFLFCQLSLQAGQSRYELETAYFQDDLQSHTVQSIQSQEFKPYQGQLRLGFVEGETWVRIRLKAPPSTSSTDQAGPAPVLVLRVEPYSLDRLTFYQQQEDRWTSQQGGELQPPTKKVCIDWKHCFALNPIGSGSDFAYLKVQTNGARIVRTTVMSADDMQQSSIAAIESTATALSLSVALLILSIAFFVLERSRLLLVFCIFQVSVVLSICTFAGVLPQWWSFQAQASFNSLGTFFIVIRMAMTILLAWVCVVAYRPSEAYSKLVFAGLAVCCINVVLLLTGHETLAGILNYGLGFLSPFIHIWGARTVRLPMSGRWVFTAGWLIFLLIVALGFPYSLGEPDWRDQFNLIQNSGDLRLNGVPIGIVVFWLVATEKSKRNLKNLEELQALEIQAAESKAHQENLKERRELIDMLTHELKTPLSTIKFALASLKRTALAQGESAERVQHIDASVSRMDAMIEHVALSNKIERTDVHGTEETVSALELMNVVMQEYQEPERFELDIQEDVVFRADPHFLALIIENLVSNAVKYAADGKIRISIQDESESVTCFRICNRVAEDSQPDEARLFERYYRHPSFQNRPGMGIGLSLVHSAAEKMGASVRYLKADQEVIFEVRFPR
jgi:signal transduction histidine kinase